MRFSPHRPMSDRRHAGRVIDADKRDAAELGAQVLQPLAEFAKEMGTPRIFIFEGQPQAFDRAAAFGFRQLLPGLLEHPVLSRMAAEQPAGPALRVAACEMISRHSRNGP